jgi:hypothetical protein
MECNESLFTITIMSTWVCQGHQIGIGYHWWITTGSFVYLTFHHSSVITSSYIKNKSNKNWNGKMTAPYLPYQQPEQLHEQK